MKKMLVIVVTLIGIGKSYCQTPAIDYFGQTPPGDSAIIFAPGIVSKIGRFEHAAIFSRDGKEFYFSETPSDWVFRNTRIRKYINNVWTEEKITSFSNRHIGGESTISYTNDSLIYTDGTDLWIVTRNDSDWNVPNKLPNVINSFDVQWHPSISSNGNIYFSSRGNIYKSIKKGNAYQIPELLPVPVNSSDWDADVVISPDESYIIFNSNRVGGYGDADLYISFQNIDGSWTNPKNLGSKINSVKMDDASSVSPDGKYLFFSRRTNQESDIYWVSAKFIDSLKHTNFIPYLKNKIENQTDTIGHSYNFTVPDSTFFDDDGNNTLTYSATLNNGSPLPLWLQFNNALRTFSGALDSVGTFIIKVTVTDTAKASISTIFSLKVESNTTSINQAFEQKVQVYPNPTKDKINIMFGTIGYQTAILLLTNIDGKLMFSNIVHAVATTTIDLTGNSKGMYILNLNIDGEVINKKICIE